MKIFSEFGSCWGGAIAIQASEAAVGGLETEEQPGYCHTHGHQTTKRVVKVRSSGRAVTHWKPKLNAISEHSPMTDVNGGGGVNRRTAGTYDKKRPAKVNPKSPMKAAPPLNHVEDYWKYSQATVLPAFSPTSFLF